jgi:hypothetical protein
VVADNREKLLRAAQRKRETIALVKRVVGALSLKVDQERLMQQVRDLEEEAAQLERQAEGNPATPTGGAGGMPMQQVQQQQQREAEPKPGDPKNSGRQPS